MAERYSGVLDPDNSAGGDGGEPTIVDPNAINRGDNGTGSTNSGDTGTGTGTSGRKRRSDAGKSRGPRGGGASKTKASLDIDGVSALLVLIHKAIAERSQVRDQDGILIWEISSSEGTALATAANNVIRHYDIAASQKMIDWGAAVTTALAIYAPKLAAHVDARERAIPHVQRAA